MSKKVIVVVQFQRVINGMAATEFAGRNYEYYSTKPLEEIKDHKLAVVSGNGVYCLARIVEFRDLMDKDFSGDLVPVITTFNDDDYRAELDKKKRLANLEERLEEAMKKQSKLTMLQQLANDNPEFKELLEEFKKLTE